jgi:hypothetical protein
MISRQCVQADQRLGQFMRIVISRPKSCSKTLVCPTVELVLQLNPIAPHYPLCPISIRSNLSCAGQLFEQLSQNSAKLF